MLVTIIDMEGHKRDAVRSAMKVEGGHCYGKHSIEQFDGCGILTLLEIVRVGYLDVRKVRWYSVDVVAFHSFVWPRFDRDAKSIMRTLFINNCKWYDVLVVCGRCF